MYKDGLLWYRSIADCTDDYALISALIRVIVHVELRTVIVPARAVTD
jgi:hypothetical protein